jgi:hypothetical protein
LSCQAVAARGVTVLLGGVPVNGGIADTGGYCELVDLGGFLV